MIVVVYVLSTSLALVYIMHQRPRLTRVLVERIYNIHINNHTIG